MGVQDVSHAGGNPPTLFVEVSGEETDERGRVGGSVDLVEGGREPSSNSLDVLGFGLEGLCSGPSCGPNVLVIGEAQGPCHERQVDLGHVSRPNPLNGLKRRSEGESGVGFGSVGADAKGEGAFLWG